MQDLLTKYQSLFQSVETIKEVGSVTAVLGNLIESIGPRVPIGCQCRIVTNERVIDAEVVGLREDKLLLMGYDEPHGIELGSRVLSTHPHLTINGGTGLLGRVIDSRGVAIDGRGGIYATEKIEVFNGVPSLTSRTALSTQIQTGIKALDAFIPLARGQKIGIFSASGTGKTMLLQMIARNIDADVIVLALIGERNREVYDFLHHIFDPEMLSNCVVVVSTSDTAPLARVKGAFTALSVADHFCRQGKHVALLFDSISRFARAQREIGLAIGEPPTTRGYPPSVYTLLPQIVERCGAYSYGSITGVFSVLVDGDDLDEPISDAMRGLLDGHVILSRQKAQRSHYPAIDVCASLSRLERTLLDDELSQQVARIRRALALYEESAELIQIGAYQQGSNSELDRAIELLPQIDAFLQQSVDHCEPLEATRARIQQLAAELVGEAIAV